MSNTNLSLSFFQLSYIYYFNFYSYHTCIWIQLESYTLHACSKCTCIQNILYSTWHPISFSPFSVCRSLYFTIHIFFLQMVPFPSGHFTISSFSMVLATLFLIHLAPIYIYLALLSFSSGTFLYYYDSSHLIRNIILEVQAPSYSRRVQEITH